MKSNRLAIPSLLVFLLGTAFVYLAWFANEGANDSLSIDDSLTSATTSSAGEPRRANNEQVPPKEPEFEEKRVAESALDSNPAVKLFVYYRDESDHKVGVKWMPLTFRNAAGQDLAKINRFGDAAFRGTKTNHHGEYSLPLGVALPVTVYVHALGYSPRRYVIERPKDTARELVEIEVLPSRRVWVAVEMKTGIDGKLIMGPRIEMQISSSCDMIRTRLGVESFERFDDIPPLMIKRDEPRGFRREHFNPGHALTNNGNSRYVNPKAVIGSLKCAKKNRWMVLTWEGTPIQIAEMPLGNEVVKFSFHQDLIARIESKCEKR